MSDTHRTLDELADEYGTTDEYESSLRDGPKPHLKDVTRPADVPTKLTADKSRERWCEACNWRITIGTSGEEYGHGPDCEHRIERHTPRGKVKE
ncbi:hypothetical protein ACOZ4F_19980 [Haloarcula marismortui]|uniref:hypothetical protein n=1 Tax=Haloarcula marismortui TaxID=2238 RepID=UPI003C76073B